jgi:hypothetical protein
MVASGLLEAMVALALQCIVMVTMLSATTSIAILAREAWNAHARMFADRQVEQLVDAAALRAGAGPDRPAPVAEATTDYVVLQADSDGNGVVDAGSAERTMLELRAAAATRNLLHRIGGQTMKVEERLAESSAFRLLARDGTATASPAEAWAIEIPRAQRLLLVYLPARTP